MHLNLKLNSSHVPSFIIDIPSIFVIIIMREIIIVITTFGITNMLTLDNPN